MRFNNQVMILNFLTVAEPGFHSAGQTSPCWSVYWKACTSRIVSSTDRPTGKSFMVICRRMLFSSMIKRPLKRDVSQMVNRHGKSGCLTCFCYCDVAFQLYESQLIQKNQTLMYDRRLPSKRHSLLTSCEWDQTTVEYQLGPNRLQHEEY